MPSKKKKYNARFPAGRIKKIMQTDEEVGKVAQAVPVIISRTLELFVESLLTKTLRITNARNAKTLSPSHMKQCIMSESQFDFLRELVKNVPDINMSEEMSMECLSPGPNCDSSTSAPSSPQHHQQQQQSQQQQQQIPGSSRSSGGLQQQQQNGISNMTGILQQQKQYPTHSKSFDMQMPQQSVIQHTSSHSSNNNNNTNNNYNNNSNTSSSSSTSSNNNNNHYKNDYGRPPKLSRYDSAPSNLATTPTYKIDLAPKLNTPLINDFSNPIFNIDLSQSNILQQHHHHQQQQHKKVPNLTPIVKIDLTNTFQNHVQQQQHLHHQQPSTSKEIPSPPIIRGDSQCNTPILKIDYSKIGLIPGISSPLSSPEFPSPIPIEISIAPQPLKSSSSSGVASSSSSSSTSGQNYKKPQTSINIDLSTFNSSIMKTAKNIYPTTNNSASLDMDEDYDNI